MSDIPDPTTPPARTRRAASTRAAVLSAAQLDSSPQSERDAVFGEPPGSRGSVRVTYGKGKKGSPRKEKEVLGREREESPTPARSSEEPARAGMKRGRADEKRVYAGVRGRSRERSPASDDSLPVLTDSEGEDGHAPVGISAGNGIQRKNGSRSLKRPASTAGLSTPTLTSKRADGPLVTPRHATTNEKKRAAPKRGKQTHAHATKGEPISAAPVRSPSKREANPTPQLMVQTPRGRKRTLDARKHARSMSSDGSLSALSSPLSEIRSSATKPPLSRTISQWSSLSSVSTETPSNPLAADSRGRKSALPRTVDMAESWSVDTLGELVWVRLTLRGDIVDYESMNADSVWWPAKVTSQRTPLPIYLLGDSPSDSKDVEIKMPSAINVLAMTCNGALRFNEANFRQQGPISTPRGSPKKKQRTDLEARWARARTLMLQADEEDNDGLPAVLSTYVGPGPFGKAATVRPNGTTAAFVRVSPDLEEGPWRAPPPDARFAIPGEPVLAKDKRSRPEYWPGKIVEYVPPGGPREKAKYRVVFYDGTVKDLEPTQFYSQDDEGFETCLLGKDAFDYGLNDDNVSDWENDDEEDLSEKALRTVSPAPLLPPPSDFDALPLEDQFAYVKPVLLSVVRGDYGPSNESHDGFMRGGGARQKVRNAGYERGDLSQREVVMLERLIRRWVKKNDRREQTGGPVHPESTVNNGIYTNELPEANAAGENEKISRSRGSSESREIAAEALTSLSSAMVAPIISAKVNGSTALEPAECTSRLEHRTDAVTVDQKEATNPPTAVSGGSVSQRSTEPSISTSTEVHAQVRRPSIDRASRVDGALARARPSATFKELNALDKIAYCTDVLLREAILQLLLWRSSHRSDAHVLAPDEEQRLHDLALGLAISSAEAEDFAWVQGIIQMKLAFDNSSRARVKANGSGTHTTPSNVGRTRSRRRNA